MSNNRHASKLARELHVVREKLTAPSCKRPDPKQPCQSIPPDALLVQTITAKHKENIIKPQLIDEAANWNLKWLEDQTERRSRT